jgi:uroporphyrinogen decarboxylase
MQNLRLIKALKRQPVDRVPIWLMRQAGRYLPEYRALRQKAPHFMDFCKNPELTVQATLQPINRFELDAAIIFSDILVVPDAMGAAVEFIEGEGPHFRSPIRCSQDIANLKKPNVNESLHYVFTAIQQVAAELKNRIPLIGFAGSPWTCAAYMVEGKSSKDFAILKSLMYQQPHLLHSLLEKITQVTMDYLQAQIAAGVQVLMVFDTWGGVLTESDYLAFSLRYLQMIAKELKKSPHTQQIPLIFFTKGGGQWLPSIAQSGCDAVGLDWTINISTARQQIGDKVSLQGNLDPIVLLTNPETIEKKVQTILNDFGPHAGLIFNLGHGILPQTPPENVQACISAVHQYSTKK